ncbi:hypothetical protein Z042_14465 [Chania multitudinisentens RB-25]|uniref:Lipoprotein n=1 Tax=Chania multitudinisentens RB-25 TaxID=1441930 RepID=W0LK68_9GAMM|nr:DUF3313 family protein [Chania multitudinisentens]AHG22819.1 hypothetical protein Z042_14465 [Chania multitudinisentens RB-25]
MKDLKAAIISSLLFILMLTGCAKLPESSYHSVKEQENLRVIQQDRALIMAVHPDFDVGQYDGLILGDVTVRSSTANDKREMSESAVLNQALAQHLALQLKGSQNKGLRMEIELYDIQPVDPTLNVLSAIVLLVPLDSGALTMKTTFRDNAGQVQVVRIERISGSVLNISESFSRYGRLNDALSDWARQWGNWPVCMADKTAKT